MAYLSESLERILQVSPVAWYRGQGKTAYYERATVDAPGVVAVNGQRIACVSLPKVDLSQPYHPQSSQEFRAMVKKTFASYGIPIEYGWTCPIEARGLDLRKALAQSSLAAARHADGRAAVQCIDQQRAALFLEQQRVWTINLFIPDPFMVLTEFGLRHWTGWISSEIDFLQPYRASLR